ncbi:hypothetical protein ABBQ32_005961 [Trebouxia sp. C0010 RCD-2024]
MVPAVTDDIVDARVQGIPTDQVFARLLRVGETLVDVFVKWRGLSMTSTSRRVTRRVSWQRSRIKRYTSKVQRSAIRPNSSYSGRDEIWQDGWLRNQKGHCAGGIQYTAP